MAIPAPLHGLALLCCGLLLSCSAVKIETGQTHEEAVASAESEARRLRVEFAGQMQRATPPTQARIVIGHVDSTAARLSAFGFEVAREWRRGNAGRGSEVPDTEMRRVVNAWVDRQQPILSAWEDNLEYGLNGIKESRHFPAQFLELMERLADSYYELYSTVLFPSGSVDEYEDAVDRARRNVETVSRRCREELDRY